MRCHWRIRPQLVCLTVALCLLIWTLTHQSHQPQPQQIHLDLTGNSSVCDSWCHRGERLQPPYFLSAVLLVRIYQHDPAQLSSRELHQWLQYLRYAGVQHVYVYDAYVLENESQLSALKAFIDSGYVTYIDWYDYAHPFSVAGTQVRAYRHCINHYGDQSEWHITVDIDEYPFSASDREPNFLPRLITDLSERDSHVSEILINNFLFLGQPLDEDQHPVLVDRLLRRTLKPTNDLVIPIFRPKCVQARVHRNKLICGIRKRSTSIRLNHYWGKRLQMLSNNALDMVMLNENWGERLQMMDYNAEVKQERTVYDDSIRVIVGALEKCDWCLGTDMVYVKRWN